MDEFTRIPSGLRIRLHENFATDGFYLYFRDKNFETGVISFAEPVVMKAVENLSVDPPPAIQLPRDLVQDLFNQLWQLGFRPRKYGEQEGELKATKYHLEDMRKLIHWPTIEQMKTLKEMIEDNPELLKRRKAE